MCSPSLIKVPRSLFILSRCLCLLSFLYEADQSVAFSLIWLTRVWSAPTLSGFSAITKEQKCLRLRRYAFMVSAVYLFSAYSLRKVSEQESCWIRNLFSFGGQLSLEYDTTESRVAWTIFDPFYRHVEITSISFSTFEQWASSAYSIITLSSLMDGSSNEPVSLFISTSPTKAPVESCSFSVSALFTQPDGFQVFAAQAFLRISLNNGDRAGMFWWPRQGLNNWFTSLNWTRSVTLIVFMYSFAII